MYIKNIHIENFRNFHCIDIPLKSLQLLLVKMTQENQISWMRYDSDVRVFIWKETGNK